jgi:uncharacterized protein YegJ (DUF2314 family)
MTWIVIGGSLAALILALVLLSFYRRRQRADRLVSIVLMRTSPRELSEVELRTAVRRAIPRDGVDVVTIPPQPGTPEGLKGAFGVTLGGMAGFLVLNASKPYVDDPLAESRKFEDPRSREAFGAHSAWVSVDVSGGAPPKSVEAGVTALMARIAAELLDDGCTLLYATHLSRVALPDQGTRRTLRGDNPMSIFGDDAANIPIIQVEAGDAKVEKAMAEARKRWPQFVQAWSRLGPACEGLVKGRFATTEGGSEYIWVEVSQAADTHATGTVMNRPANVDGLKQGDTVRVEFGEIVDWAYQDRGKPVGLFVERLLRQV